MPHTYCINVLFVGSNPQATSGVPHGGDHGPLVDVWVIALSRAEAAMPVETPANVHLQTGLGLFNMDSTTDAGKINARKCNLTVTHFLACSMSIM